MSSKAMQLPMLGRLVVSARARGMPEIQRHGKLFFPENRWRLGAYWLSLSSALLRAKLSVVRKIIRPISRRSAEILVAVNQDAASAPWHVFVRCDNHSATGLQAHDQSPVGGDTDDPTAHRARAAPR